MNETLHLHLQMNYNGRYVIRDGVIALNQITQGVFGTKLVALRCQEYLEDMIEAIDKVNAEQKSNEPL